MQDIISRQENAFFERSRKISKCLGETGNWLKELKQAFDEQDAREEDLESAKSKKIKADENQDAPHIPESPSTGYSP